MEEVFQYVQGELSNADFEQITEKNPEIWTWLQSLLDSQLENGTAVLTNGDRMRLEANGNYVKYTALSFGINDISHDLISHIVEGSFPDIQPRFTPSSDQAEPLDILETLGLQYLGGPETDALIEEIIQLYEDIRPKKTARADMKKKLREVFHLVPRKVPVWIQEPEWPMGENSPMEYLGTHRDGERAQFCFRDTDTGEERTIEQFY